MAVAAANKQWLPRLFSFVGFVGVRPRQTSAEASGTSPGGHEGAESDAPLNAIILSTLLSTVYILLGNFRALVTFNGLAEYSFFFLTVLGAIILRIREPGLHRPYKPFVLVPVIFAAVSGFVVVLGAIFAPLLTLVLVIVWIIGLAFYQVRKRLSTAPNDVAVSG